MKKRLLSILLVLVMVLSLIPGVGVYAGETDKEAVTDVNGLYNGENNDINSNVNIKGDVNVNDIVSPSVNVCKIGGTEYASIYDALGGENASAAPMGEDVDSPTEIVLIADNEENFTIPAERYITLNLNGKVLKADLTEGDNQTVIQNYGTLTIKDSSTGAEHYFDYVKDGAWKLNTTADNTAKASAATPDTINAETKLVKVSGGCITGSNGSCIVLYSGSQTTLNNINLVGNSSAQYGKGGAIRTERDSSTTINDCLIAGNKGGEAGGAIFMFGGTINMYNSQMIYNTVSFAGGAVDCNRGTFHMYGGSMEYNHCAGNGGAVFNGRSASSFHMHGGSIRYNTCDGFGGGIYDIKGDITFEGACIVTDNTAKHSDVISVTDNVYTTATFAIDDADGKNETTPASLSGSCIGVTASNVPTITVPVAFTSNGNSTDVNKFISDNPRYIVAYNVNGYFELVSSEACKWYYDEEDGGNHVAGEEYIISGIDELEVLADIVNSGEDDFENKIVKLDDKYKNIKLDGTAASLTTPIGTSGNPFKGTFDGNGKNVVLDITGKQYAGLFGYVGTTEGMVKNVSTSGTVSAGGTGETYAGGVVGYLKSTMINCSSTATVSATGDTENNAGGLIGKVLGGYVYNCYAAGTVSATGTGTNHAGGLVGTGDGSLCNCYASGSVSTTGGTENNKGGIVGYVDSPDRIVNCYYLVHDDADDAKDVNEGVSLFGACQYPEYSSINSLAMDCDQMMAGSGETDGSWADIQVNTLNEQDEWDTASGYSTPQKVSLTDALNDFAHWVNDYNPAFSHRYWGVMKESINDGYPIFASERSIYLLEGQAYSDEKHTQPITMPDGITYSSGIYTLTDVNLEFINSGTLSILDDEATINLEGDNQLGVRATADSSYNSTQPFYGYGNMIIDGNGKLIVYGGEGIHSDGLLTIAGGTIYVMGIIGFYSGKELSFIGGISYSKGSTYAVFSETKLTVGSNMTIAGVGKYAEADMVFDNDELTENTLAIANQTGSDAEEYVVIAEKEVEPPCKYNVSLTAGENRTLILGGKEAGTFTITGNSCRGFSLKDENGNYITIEKGTLNTSDDNAFFRWKYDGGLYAEVKTTCKTGFGSRCRTKTRTTRYYLNVDDLDGFYGPSEIRETESRAYYGLMSSTPKLTLDTVRVEAYVQMTAQEHALIYKDNRDGTHSAFCKNCGDEIVCQEEHDAYYDKTNHKCSLCGSADPAYCRVTNVKVNVKKECYYEGWLFFGRKVTEYKYIIKPVTENVHVAKTEYSTNNKRWDKGGVIFSERKLNKFYIRVTDSNGKVTKWIYQDGKVSQL